MKQCLFCKKSTGPFKSREHVIPEGLGNNNIGGKKPIILDKGVVCDVCNNGPLASLDQALINFDLIAFLRTSFTVPGKGGKLSSAVFSNNASMKALAPGHVLFDSKNSNAWVNVGPNEFKINFRSRVPIDAAYRKRLARSLFKMTLGCMYIDKPTLAMSSRFDPIREMVLGSLDFEGYVTVVCRSWQPTAENPRSELKYGFIDTPLMGKTVFSRFDFLRMSLFSDLEVRSPQLPQLYGGDEATVLEF